MQIGDIKLRNNLIVAPMAGVTDRPFRQLCKRLGAGMAVSEMVASNSLLWGSEKTIRRGNHEGEVEPKVILALLVSEFAERLDRGGVKNPSLVD